jgi:hypothetical protein
MKRKDIGPRLRPKLKDFVNGSFPHNPMFTQYGLDIWEDAIGRYTGCIANMIHHPFGYMALANMIRMRARAARLMAMERKKIIAFKRKKGNS